MRATLAHVIRLLCAVAFLTGATLGIACPEAMASPAKPMSATQATTAPAHDCGMDGVADSEDPSRPDHGSTTMVCCHALGSATPSILAGPAQLIPPPLVRSVTYWAFTAHPAGRAIAPDLDPPRPV
jgi:hypothetical protein